MPDQLEQFANYVYGPGGPPLGNTLPDDGWRFKGHGLKQLTGRDNTREFANYVDLHPIGGQPTGLDIMNDPQRHIADNMFMAARSAGFYWSRHVGNSQADSLVEGNPNRPTMNAAANRYLGGNQYTDIISIRVGNDEASFPDRFVLWQSNLGQAYSNRNPYESMRDVLNRLGIRSSNATGFEQQFGITLRPPSLVKIGGGSANLLVDEPSVKVTSLDQPPGNQLELLLTEAKNTLGWNEGDYTMFVADPPYDTGSLPAIVIAANIENQQSSARREKILGV